MGHIVDDQERLLIGGVAVDVTPRGVATVWAVLKRNGERLASSQPEMVRGHCAVGPADILDEGGGARLAGVHRRADLGDAQVLLEVRLNLRLPVEGGREIVDRVDGQVERWTDPLDCFKDVRVLL